jgi:signal peptidase I
MQPPIRSPSIKLLAVLLIWSVVTAVALHRYVFALYIIQGSSMSPTLNDGDTALVNMLVRRIGHIERGEIVLVRDGFDDYATKRIVGLPGERIEFRDERVYVNGRPLKEWNLARNATTLSPRSAFVLGRDQYFVLGDNRADSYDSRVYGPVSKDAIIGSYTRTFWACR